MKDFVNYRNNLKKYIVKYDLEYLRTLPGCYKEKRPSNNVVKNDVCYAVSVEEVYAKLCSIYDKNAIVRNLEVLEVKRVPCYWGLEKI